MPDQMQGGVQNPPENEQSESQHEQNEKSQGGFTICIYVAPDKSIQVGVMEGAEDMDTTNYQSAGSINEALDMAKMIFRDEGSQDTTKEEQAGFAQARRASATSQPSGSQTPSNAQPSMG